VVKRRIDPGFGSDFDKDQGIGLVGIVFAVLPLALANRKLPGFII
jgi:hypothetical protein